MLIALIVMFVLLLIVAWFARKFYRESLRWGTEAAWWQYEYNKIDQGMSEVTDAYETDSLQYETTLADLVAEQTLLYEAIEEYKRRIDEQRQSLERKAVREAENQEAILGLGKRLDIAQKIITDHDLNCLPHIVLSSMETKPVSRGWIKGQF